MTYVIVVSRAYIMLIHVFVDIHFVFPSCSFWSCQLTEGFICSVFNNLISIEDFVFCYFLFLTLPCLPAANAIEP